MAHPLICEGKTIVDTSCGRGGGSLFIEHHLWASRVIGIDNSQRNLNIAQKLLNSSWDKSRSMSIESWLSSEQGKEFGKTNLKDWLEFINENVETLTNSIQEKSVD